MFLHPPAVATDPVIDDGMKGVSNNIGDATADDPIPSSTKLIQVGFTYGLNDGKAGKVFPGLENLKKTHFVSIT